MRWPSPACDAGTHARHTEAVSVTRLRESLPMRRQTSKDCVHSRPTSSSPSPEAVAATPSPRRSSWRSTSTKSPVA
jgi:hypothetical protein